MLLIVCAHYAHLIVSKDTKYPRRSYCFCIGICWNILSQLARDKLVCREACSEEMLCIHEYIFLKLNNEYSPPAKVCTKEHELYTEALQVG